MLKGKQLYFGSWNDDVTVIDYINQPYHVNSIYTLVGASLVACCILSHFVSGEVSSGIFFFCHQ